MASFSARFQARTGQELKANTRLQAMDPKAPHAIPDLVDDMSNEVLAYVEAQRVGEDLRRNQQNRQAPK